MLFFKCSYKSFPNFCTNLLEDQKHCHQGISCYSPSCSPPFLSRQVQIEARTDPINPWERLELGPPSVHHLSHIETEQKWQWDVGLKSLHVHTSLLKAHLHILVPDHDVPVAHADDGVCQEVHHKVLPYTLDDTSLP